MMILHLNLKKVWFDLILSGVKKQEYREIKPYWIKRLFNADFGALPVSESIPYMSECFRYVYEVGVKCATPKYDTIRFCNGYDRNAPTFDIELKSIKIGVGNKE